MPVCVIDFETYSPVSLKRYGAVRYAQNPHTKIVCLSYSVDKNGPYWWRPGWPTTALHELASNPDVTIVSFGFFEQTIWKYILEPQFGIPMPPLSRWHDIRAVCAMRQMPQSVEGAAEFLEIPMAKTATAKKIIRTLSSEKLWEKAKDDEKFIRDVGVYCGQDVRIENELHERLNFLPPNERRVWLHYQKMNWRGVKIDIPYITGALRCLETYKNQFEEEFVRTYGFRPTQRGRLLAEFQKHVEVDDLRRSTLEKLTIEDDEVDYLLQARALAAATSTAKYMRLLQCVSPDGRLRGMYNYHGTGPGRATSNFVQLQNLPRPRIKIGDIELFVKLISEGDGALASDIWEASLVDLLITGLRYSFMAEPDRIFVARDYERIQAKITLALAGQDDKLAMLESGKDVYVDMASQIFKCAPEQVTSEQRMIGKMAVLGLGFQMGATKFSQQLGGDQHLEFADRIVQTYRNDWAPKVRQMWYNLHAASSRAVWDGKPAEAHGVVYALRDAWLTARLPSGRLLWYPRPQKERKAFGEDFYCSWSFTANRQGMWRRIMAFGGLLTENVVMGVERDIIMNARLALEKEKFPVVMDAHDEIVLEPKFDHFQENGEVVKQIMEDVPSWLKPLGFKPTIEGWEGRRYRK